MRACKLGLVESSNSVARLVLEPHDRTVVAAVVSESSCILASLEQTVVSKNREKHKQLRIKVPSICDLSFIRLEVRDTPTTPTSGSSSTTASTSGYVSNSNQRKVGGQELLQFGQFTPMLSEQQHQPGDTDQAVVVHNVLLVASPGLGGSCTDLRAWGCDGSNFKQVHVEAGVVGTRRSGMTGVFARFEIPATGVKIAASVNLMVVLAPSVSKLWVFAVKSQFKGGKHSLLILNTSVLEARDAVRAVHMSPHYLFLSGPRGMRVLPLRPLVKVQKASKVVGSEKTEKKAHGKLNGVHENSLMKRNGRHEEEMSTAPGECNGYCIDKQCMKAREHDERKNGPVPHCQVELVKQPGVEQLVAIHALAPMQFVMLDTSGTLHVLVLRAVTSPSSRSLEVEVKTIRLPFAVASFTVFPEGFDAAGSSHSGAYPKFWNLWVTDGKNSIYVLGIYDATFITEDYIFPMVMQAVFMGSRIDSVCAVSKDTVLALSEGALVAYVNAGE